jgi:WD40 repeat protein
VFSGDGKQAFSGSSDGTAILWDIASGAILHRFGDHSGPIAEVDMTSDGHLGIAGSADGTSTLWDLQTGELIRRYSASGYNLIFAPNHRTAVVSSYSLELWRIDTTLDELLAWTRANRYIPELTCDQRDLYRVEPLCEAGTTVSG